MEVCRDFFEKRPATSNSVGTERGQDSWKNLGSIPGDSIRDLFIPWLEVTNNHLKGALNHPKKVTKNCQVCGVFVF